MAGFFKSGVVLNETAGSPSHQNSLRGTTHGTYSSRRVFTLTTAINKLIDSARAQMGGHK